MNICIKNLVCAALVLLGISACADTIVMSHTLTPKDSLPPAPKMQVQLPYAVHLADSTDYHDNDYLELHIVDKAGYSFAKLKKDSLRLWVGGVCFKNMHPLWYNDALQTVEFKLAYDTSEASPWKKFYAYPYYFKFNHVTMANLGTASTMYTQFTPVAMHLCTTSLWMVAAGYLLIILLCAFLFVKCKGVLKDTAFIGGNVTFTTEDLTVEQCIAQGKIRIRDVQYSIARFQFLFWLLIIFWGVVHIWSVTDTLVTPTSTVLILIGISGGTMYIGRLIDVSSPAQPANTPAPPAPGPGELVKAFYDKGQFSKSFIQDILSDGYGVSLHRLQLFIFTVFLGFYFIWFVIYGLELPEFSNTFLGLMGISSTTYAGLKTIEK